MQIDDDHSLLAAARLGDQHAYGRLVEQHRPGLELYCGLMLGCPERAHRATQEALLRGWSELDRLEAAASARIWLYRLATGVCLEGRDGTDHTPITDRSGDGPISDRGPDRGPISFGTGNRWTT